MYKATIRDKHSSIDKRVAVKVMHPNMDERIDIDMQLIKCVGWLLEHIPGFIYLGPSKEINTFCVMMETQLDLKIEATNLIKFNRNFENDNNLQFPQPVMHLCTENVLVESYHAGILLNQWLKHGSSPFDSEIAKTGLNAFMVIIM